MDLTAWKMELDQLVMEILSEQVKKEALDLEEEEGEQECSESVNEKVKFGKKEKKERMMYSDSDEDSDFKESMATRGPSKMKKRKTSKDNRDDSTSKKPKLPSKGGFMAMLQLSPDLADIVGEDKMQRHEVT